MSLIDPLRPYVDLLRWAGIAAIGVALFIGGCKHGQRGLAEVKAKHAATLEDIAKATQDQALRAAEVRDGFKLARREQESAYKKGVQDAYERGMATGAEFGTGERPVNWVWRDNCPKAPAGEGSGPDGGDSGVSADRAAAIGRVLGIGGAADAHETLLRNRLQEAQKLLNACYEEPAR
jgi:hypothetical protein